MLRLLLKPSNWPAVTLLLAPLLLLGGCGGGEGIILPGDGEPAAIAVTDGDEQQGKVGEPLTNPVVVMVTDTRGRPVEGAAVEFALTSAGSEVVPPQKSTDAEGKADARLVLGTTFGRQTGNARVVTQGGRPGIQTDFSAMALPVDANTMAAAGGQDQSGHVGTQLDERLVVRVTDRFENPVEGVPITWVAEGGGSVSAEVVQTDEDGESGVRRTLGPSVGQQTAVARSEGLAGSPVTFVHTALAGDASRLVLVSGNNQTALAGSALPADLVVRLLDSEGNGIPATAVSWVVATGGGRANPENSTTDDGGRTSAKWILGNAVGEQRLDAVVSGVGVASFRATATSPVLATNTTITADLPDPSIANSEFPVEFRVTSSGPTPTGTVRVTVSEGPATCTATLSGGVGSCTLRLGGLGDRTITAIYSGAPGFSGSSDTEPHRVEPAPPDNEAPSADFNWHCEDLTCFFTDRSEDDDGTITNWHWDFGDGASVDNQVTPSHTYAAPGNYRVILTVTDNGGLTGQNSDEVDPEAPPPPQNKRPNAEFEVACSDLTCTFSDQSNDDDGSIVSRSWDYGDGSSGAEPSHTYAVAGTYRVTLTVTDNGGGISSKTHDAKPTAPPPPPTANDDEFTVNEGSTVSWTLDVLANDQPKNGLTPEVVSGPVTGTSLALNSDGTFEYTPGPDYYGPDSFTYRVSNGTQTSNTATVRITVNSVNDAPQFELPQDADQSVAADAPPQSVSNFTVNPHISPSNGSENEQTGMFILTITNGRTDLFAPGGQPAISYPGNTLTYTPSGATGRADVTVVLKDDGGTANGGRDTSDPRTFTIEIGGAGGVEGD